MKKIILLLMTLLALPQILLAQAGDQVEMADKLRADGKIWVVVAVVAIVLAGIAINMFRVDSKVSRIEKELNIK